MYDIPYCSATEVSSSDPWWIYTTCNLFWVIKSEYGFGITELVRESPRFGIMLLSMCLSIAFLVVDTLSVLHVFRAALPTGINPFWKLSFVFKCLCDTIILDDFKTALDRLRDYWLMKNGDIERLPSRNPVLAESAASGPRTGSSGAVNNCGGSIEFIATNRPSVEYKPSGSGQALPPVKIINVSASERV